MYRKESFTGIGTSFFSYCPFNFKINSIKKLVHRAYHICSNNLHLHNEFNFLLSYFTNNGYPSKLVHSCVRKFLDSIYCPQTILSCDKFKLYVSFPYFGPQSFNLKKDLLSLSNKYFPGISFNFILTNNLTLGSYFRFKDALPIMSRSSIIYSYVCTHCGAQYVGSTARTLFVQSSEHSGKSHRTGLPVSCPKHSAIRSHTEQVCNAAVSNAAFSIVDSTSNELDLRILESIYIHDRKPILNDKESAFNLQIIK